MNKKLLFGIMSLAALAACTNDDFDSQQQVAEGTSPVQFEVVNNDASMRASMDGDAVKFSATAGDLFTLYHGVTVDPYLTGYQNATYKATEDASTKAAVLTTPSMILPGKAIMVWPADTTFSIKSTDNLSFSIPAEQPKDIENYIPYASDLIDIDAYAAYNETTGTDYNTAGKDRKYPVYMRTMASLLKLKADYAGTDATLKTLYTGDDPIDPISATSVQLVTQSGGATEFTTTIPVTFTAGGTADAARWDANVPNNAFSHITGVDRDNVTVKSATLTTECVEDDNSGCKFIILPQAAMLTTDGTGVLDGGVVVNTLYGKVYIAETYPAGYPDGCKYSTADIAGAWYRYVSAATTADEGETNPGTPEASGDYAGKYKVTSKPEFGLQQTINAFGTSTAGASKPAVQGEYIGAVTTRFVKVLLTKLNMEDLHIESDKQLRDVVRVWQKMNLPSVTVYLDGDDPTDAAGKFTISQKTIKKINEINAAVASAGRAFTVMPCQTAKEICKEIVITGADTDANLQDIAFIKKNGAATAKVVLANETTAWKWNGTTATTKKVLVGEGVERIINKGTMLNDASATLATWSVTYAPITNVMTAGAQSDIKLQNDGTWNITAGTLRVQSDVVNYGTVNIAAGAEYLQDGNEYLFTNQAKTLPKRITKADTETIGLVNNSGVFATLNDGKINNYGLIEHLTKSAKTYITRNEIGGTDFSTPFEFNTKAMGRINLTYDNKDEDNISISAAAAQGFVSITITEEDGEDDLKTSLVENSFVNYIIVNGGVEQISALPTKIKYVEINQPGTEMVWNLSAAATYEGLIVLSPVNVKLGQTITINKATYIGAKMYVGGTFTKGSWSGYYGDTTDNSTTMYVTY